MPFDDNLIEIRHTELKGNAIYAKQLIRKGEEIIIEKSHLKWKYNPLLDPNQVIKTLDLDEIKSEAYQNLYPKTLSDIRSEYVKSIDCIDQDFNINIGDVNGRKLFRNVVEKSTGLISNDIAYIEDSLMNNKDERIKSIKDILILFYFKLQCNSFPHGLFLLIANINHSCAPNCKVRYEELDEYNRLVVLSTRDIHPEEEITISYLDADKMDDYPIRARKLESVYYFSCNCLYCNMKSEGDYLRWLDYINADENNKFHYRIKDFEYYNESRNDQIFYLTRKLVDKLNDKWFKLQSNSKIDEKSVAVFKDFLEKNFALGHHKMIKCIKVIEL